MTSFNLPPQSPYNRDIPDLSSATPELEHVLQSVMGSTMARLNVCVPARVNAVLGDQRVDLQLLPRILYSTATQTTERPILPEVPVCMPMGGDWAVTYPLAVGDLGLAIFADRSLDNYLAGTGTGSYSPDDTRMHDAADAIFLPGLPTDVQQTSENGDLVVRNGQAQLRVTKDGKIVAKNGQNELLAVIDELLDVLQTQFYTSTMMGPSPPLASTIQAIGTVRSKLATLKEG